MEVGIVGLPGVGKTTLFTALTGADVDHFGEKAHLGIACIPDPRLGQIAENIATKKILPATIKLVDIPSTPVGSDPKKLNAILEQIRQVDAICHVVRAFDDGVAKVDPASDLDTMDTELILADLVVAEGAKDKATRNARSGDADAKARVALLERVISHLEEPKPLRSLAIGPDEVMRLKSYGFISAKPVVYVANISEDDLPDGPAAADAVRAWAADSGAPSVALCAKLEAELTELGDADRDEMLGSLGLVEPAIGPLARAALNGLGLTTFYTAGEKEVRAWTIPIGATAPAAAGAIHTDLERGFIRAECYSVQELNQFKTEKAIKEAGKMRSEGKNYQMQDGDVVHFLFNV